MTEINDRKIADIFIISLSSCSPCRKTKLLLDGNNVDYDYIDIDTASEEEWEQALDLLDDFMSGRGMSKVYPIIIVKGRKMIQGYDEKKLNSIIDELRND